MILRNDRNDPEPYIELDVLEILADLPQEGDTRLGITVAAGDFIGQNEQVWVDRDALIQFLDVLRHVEETRVGAAELRSMGPDEFVLRIAIIDRAGHAAVEGHLSRLHRCLGRSRTNTIAFGFEIDPTLLPRHLSEFASWISR